MSQNLIDKGTLKSFVPPSALNAENFQELAGKAVIEELGRRARGNTPEQMRVAVPWYKPERNETDLVPDYFIRETGEWLVFPHELDALSPQELRQERPQIAAIIESAKESKESA